jgi:hypothetical protein
MKKSWMTKVIAVMLCLGIFVSMNAVNLHANAQETEVKITWLSKKYDDISEFHDGLAAVCLNNKWGFIDTTGREIIQPQYNIANAFSEGLAAVCSENGWGFIDTTGKIIVPMKYDSSFNFFTAPYFFSDGLANVGIRDDGYFNLRFGFINKKGDIVVPLKYDDILPFSEGLAAVCKDEKWGYINTSGKVVLPLKYGYVGSFQNGLAKVDLSPDPYVWDDAYINIKGEVIISSAEYSYINDFNEGFAAVRSASDKKWGFINTSGELVVPLIYEDVSDFRDGIARIETLTEKIPIGQWAGGSTIYHNVYSYKYIDTRGNEIKPLENLYLDSFSEGLAVARDATKEAPFTYGYVDKNGKVILPFEYDEATNFSDGYALVNKGELTGIVHTNTSNEKSKSESVTAIRSSAIVYFNGEKTQMDAYNINGNNYFKLRDIAMALTTTAKQFDVTYDGNKNAIYLITGRQYSPVGGELSVTSNMENKTPSPTTSIIFVDDKQVNLTTYNIDGFNYFRLRDLGQAINFGVKWDNNSNTIQVDTAAVYSNE